MDTLLDFFKAYDISLSQVVAVVIILLLTVVAWIFQYACFFTRYEKSTHQSQTVKTIVYMSLKKPLAFGDAFSWSLLYSHECFNMV